MPFQLPWQPRAHRAACGQLTTYLSPLTAHSVYAFLAKMSPAPSRINLTLLWGVEVSIFFHTFLLIAREGRGDQQCTLTGIILTIFKNSMPFCLEHTNGNDL